MVKVLNKSGKKVNAEEVVLSSGKTALAFVADSDGMYYVNINNYHKEQFKYKIGIGNYTAKPDEPLIPDNKLTVALDTDNTINEDLQEEIPLMAATLSWVLTVKVTSALYIGV